MPKYIIHCSTTRSYHLILEAPNKDAAHAYYEGSDGDEFWPGDEGCWSFHEISEIHDYQSYGTTDFRVDADGDVIGEGSVHKAEAANATDIKEKAEK